MTETKFSFLKVDGEKIVDGNGNNVTLKGAGLGGWMNMENFITGYPGHEHQHRAAMLAVLGPEKYEYFFDQFLTHFFNDADAAFFASLGLNCLRIPFNYHHFEDDMNPRVLKTSGFKHLDRVVDLCEKHGIWTVLDLHAVPGGQNPDWHSDNPTNAALFWEFKDFQDRVVWLWEELAKHYKDRKCIAGYNPLNEPADPKHVRLPRFYDRIEKAIRKVDANHVLWLDGNTFAMDFQAFDSVLPNTVYAIHDYSMMGFPTGTPYTSNPSQDQKLESQLLRKTEFMRQHQVPTWNGEFGPVYAPPSSPDADTVNTQRYNLLGAQLRIYEKYNISWSIWTYKDIGMQGMVYADPKGKWMKTLQPFIEKKKKVQADAWGYWPSEEVDGIFGPLVEWISKNAPDAAQKYPDHWDVKRHVSRLVKECFLSETLSAEFARYFEGMGMEELGEMAKSFAFERVVQREGLNQILLEHASLV
ncbi:glycoside hydrolase superfamily [Morchella snyderi]|nr:glycoside hydrolase superfamily [Morchella snyderi]